MQKLGYYFAEELKREAISATKMLERVPFDKWDWKPHERSMTLGQLATHVANITAFPAKITMTNELDFANAPKPKDIENTAELVDRLKTNVAQSAEKLNAVNDDELQKDWTLRNGDHVIFTLPRAAAVRGLALNHFVHHRGQLSVYLRMLNIPIPSIYGPSADEMN
jgi:uncharacterized damage-inducible protein DinB